MAFKEIIALVFGCIVVDNWVFNSFFGIESVSSDNCYKTITVNSLWLTLILAVSSVINSIVNLGLVRVAFLQTLIYSIIILAVTTGVSALAKKNFVPFAFNSVVLGVSLKNASEGYGLGFSLLIAVSVGLGFMLSSLVVAGVREKINEKYVPASWRGLPILVAAMGIISLVFFAF